jgi:hypothetical protein
MNEANGYYTELVITGIKTRERAALIKQGLFNAARCLKVSMCASIEAASNGYQVRYKAISKKHARAYILSKYGPDRETWEAQGGYNPRKKASK